MKQKQTEKRKHPRYAVEEHAIVALHNDLNRVGKGKDISLGGCSFEHVYEESLDGGSLSKKLTLLINDFSLKRIPCRIIYDIPLQIPAEYEFLTIRLIPRRCGIEFESLTAEQNEQLISFLRSCAQKDNE